MTSNISRLPLTRAVVAGKSAASGRKPGKLDLARAIELKRSMRSSWTNGQTMNSRSSEITLDQLQDAPYASPVDVEGAKLVAFGAVESAHGLKSAPHREDGN